ncbi:rhomboid family intramembrane serine protease [Hymenobacter persicinus]|uniref:Rhomboid family intramembrane serine protease n=1 Tax=Hymenobacter persicinus TaxID=2025506 RepID=A0A4V1ZAP7_9BACT|nr:rhomboid family intramembrane serine protease [Hymenobacter persicinus]RYU79138.1 rhomboid family intramembrane serine protease [Hymenobacter persicinus]
MAPVSSPDELFAQKTDAELLYLAQNALRYPPAVGEAAVRELQRRELVPAAPRPGTGHILPAPAVERGLLAEIGQQLFGLSRTYFVTPLLLLLNLAVFAAMVAQGMDAFHPAANTLIAWGSNFSPLTLHGQPWRLLTSCFLHGGVAHLLLNSLALLFLGRLSETLVGPGRLLLTYLLSGIGGSLFSLWWHSAGINSVGASGAIFGLYGLVLMLALTGAVPMTKAQRYSLIWLVLLLVPGELEAGLKATTDNAAHLGGLATGLLVGGVFKAVGPRR